MSIDENISKTSLKGSIISILDSDLFLREKNLSPEFDHHEIIRRPSFRRTDSAQGSSADQFWFNLFEQERLDREADQARIAVLERELTELRHQHSTDEIRIATANEVIRGANARIEDLKSHLASTKQEAADLRTRGFTQASETSIGEPPADFAALGIDPRTAFVGMSEDQIQTFVGGVQKLKAKVVHPDAGGDNKTMQKVNAAADRLRHPSTRGNYRR